MASKDGVGKSAGSGKNPSMAAAAKLAPKFDLKSSPPPKPKDGQVQVKKPMAKPPTTPPNPEQDKKKPAAASKAALSSSSLPSPPHKSPATAPLCNDCKAMIAMTTTKGAVCFIGNNGRVSACSMSAAGYVCKSPKCANFEQPLVPPPSEPKKFLVSKRHLLKNQLNPKLKAKGSKPNTDTNTTTTTINKNIDKTNQPRANGEQSGSDDDNSNNTNNNNKVAGNGTRAKGPTPNVGVVEETVETVTLRKQGLQARKEASEWMLNNAIEGVVQKLAPRRENRVKVLVEAFETIISSDDIEGASIEPHHLPGPIESHRPSPQNVTTRC